MPRAGANGIELFYEVAGEPSNDALLLIQGHGAQLIWWPDELVTALVDLGFLVVRFDNRDAGLSTHLDGAGQPDIHAAIAGDLSSVAYTVDDMADDAAALLAGLGIGSAHVLGISMGGMIAQALAIRHRRIVRSLTSVMSTPDPVHIGTPTDAVMAWMVQPPPASREEVIEQAVAWARAFGSPDLGIDEAWVRDLAGRQHDRSRDPDGVARQFGAMVAVPDRTPALERLDVPTLVVHGAIDQQIQVEGGIATAEAVPGAELLVIDGMGHDLPKSVWPMLLDSVARVAGYS
jgi:pimeloyl-ACP methyl ester carboxylesterase